MKSMLNAKVSTLKRGGPIVTIDSTEDVNQAIHTLFKSGTQSCPVVDKSGKLEGLIDVVDVAVHIVELLGGAKQMLQWLVHVGYLPVEDEDAKQQYETIMGKDKVISEEDILELAKPGIDILNLTKELMDHSKRNPCKPLKQDATIGELVKILLTTHRVPVVDGKGVVVNLVSQSDVVGFITFDDSLLGEHGKKTIKELGLAKPKTVISVNQCDQALEAFKAISKNNVTAVAVVDDEGKIVGNISATDVRLIDSSGDLISRLFLPCSEFIKRMQTEFIIPTKPLVVTPSETLNDVMKLMLTQKVHRVYVVEDKVKMKPLSVVSMSDLMKIVS